MQKTDLPDLLYLTIQKLGGSANMMTIFKEFWKNYGNQLSPKDDLFYTWNYDIRWAATELRKTKRMKPTINSDKGVWEII